MNRTFSIQLSLVQVSVFYVMCPCRPFFFLFISADRGSLLLGPSPHRRQKILVIQSCWDHFRGIKAYYGP